MATHAEHLNQLQIAPRPIARLAQEALDIQDACNLKAMTTAFARAIHDLGDHGWYGDGLREHPVTVLWVNKLNSLVLSDERFSKAYDDCLTLAGRK